MRNLQVSMILIVLVVFYLIAWKSQNSLTILQPSYENPKIAASLSTFPELSQTKKELFIEICLKENIDKMSLEFLPDYIQKFEYSDKMICKNVGKIFNSMFEIESSISQVKLSENFSKRVLGWLDNNQEYLKQASNQKIVRLYNKFTNEEMIFNPLRGKRPIKKPEISDEKYTLEKIQESAKTCDFCNNFKDNTAFDTFGRIETNLSYTAANAFKYDKWHSLVLSRNHNPTALTEAELFDMFSVANQWFQKVNKIDPKANYPEMLWDCMMKAGASQVHPHLQISVGSMSYYGGMRRHLDASKRYYEAHRRNYFDDFINLHKALGLTYSVDNAVLITNLVPIKEQELMIIGSNDKKGLESLIKLLHQTIEISVKKFGLFAWSMGIFFPEINKVGGSETQGTLNRTICKINFRTPAAGLRSDMSSLDFYTSSVLGIDRYQVASKLFKELSQKK